MAVWSPKRVPWNLLSVFVGVAGVALAIYTDQRDRSPQLEFDILSNTPVLTTAEDVPELKILYRDLDIRQQEQLLNVVSIRIRNSGESDIHRGHYDPRAPLGVEVRGGMILDPRIDAASSAYLREQASSGLRIVGPVALTFDPLILEVGEFFVVKFLVLHKVGSEGERVPVTARGKVAGVKQLIVKESYAVDKSPGFLSVAFAGPVGSQVVRLVAYPVALFFLLFLATGFPSIVAGYWRKSRRKKEVEDFIRKKAPPQAAGPLLKSYEDQGIRVLKLMLSHAEYYEMDPAAQAAVELAAADSAGGAEEPERVGDEDVQLPAERPRIVRPRHLGWSLSSGLLKHGPDNKLQVDREMKKTLDTFLEFLRQRSTS